MTISYLLLVILGLICFAFITWQRFHLAVAIMLFLLPTYLLRFSLGALPTTLLEVLIWIIVIIWLLKKLRLAHYGSRQSLISKLKFLTSKNRSLFISSALFLLAATISIFTSLNLRSATGEWRAFYVEPFLLFLVLITTINREPLTPDQKPITNHRSPITNQVNALLLALVLSGLATSLVAIYQHFNGWLVPPAFWGNDGSYRVTAWYKFPNAVGLYLAPIAPLALLLLVQSYNEIKRKKSIRDLSFTVYVKLIANCLFLIFAPLAILFAQSTGALIGLITGLVLLLIIWRKTRWWTIIIGLVSFVSLISLSSFYTLKQELLFQDRSGQIRLAIWRETFALLRDRPILGAGLASYQQRIAPYHTTVNSEGIEIFHHPHNIFLTMYVNLGLLGLLGFVGIVVWFYKVGLKNLSLITVRFSPHPPRPSQAINKNFALFLLSSMTIILVQGLVDSPYIKNDLALIFWLLPALMISTKNNSN